MAPPKKAQCLRGHARTPENVLSSGNCKICQNDRKRERRGRRRTTLPSRVSTAEKLVRPKNRKAYVRKPSLFLPAAPVLELLDRYGLTIKGFGPRYARVTGLKPDSGSRQLWRAQQSGRMTIEMADAVCVALGKHPFEVYGQDWFTYGSKEVADAV